MVWGRRSEEGLGYWVLLCLRGVDFNFWWVYYVRFSLSFRAISDWGFGDLGLCFMFR